MADPLARLQMNPCPFRCFTYEGGPTVSKAHAEGLHQRLDEVQRAFDAYRLTHP